MAARNVRGEASAPFQRAFAARALLVAFSLLFVFAIGEFFFRFVHNESDGFATTTANRNWDRRHRVLNSHGVRDIEWNFSTDKSKVFLLGDSFIEGAGIKRIEDRISGILRRERPDLAIYNIGMAGVGPRTEYEMLRSLPATPDMLVYSYYMNDIGILTIPMSDLGRGGWLTRESAFANWLYWRIKRRDQMFAEYARSVQATYLNALDLRVHLADVEKILAYSEQHKAELVVLLFPILSELKSESYQIMKDYFTQRGVRLIAVDEVIEERGFSWEQRVVSRVDAHPSKQLNAAIARVLLAELPPASSLR